jgi:hypothetical protein
VTLSGATCYVLLEVDPAFPSAAFATDAEDPVFTADQLRIPLSKWELRSSGVYVCTALHHVGDVNFAAPLGAGGTLS